MTGSPDAAPLDVPRARRSGRLPLLGGQPVRALLFDVDGTLYDQRRLRVRMLSRLLGWTARHPLDGLRTLRVLRSYRRMQERLREADPGEIGPGGLGGRQLALAAGACGIPEATVRALVERWMETEPLPLLADCSWPGVRRLLERARESDLPVAVVSDYPAEAKVRALGLADLVQVIVCAQDAEVGELKPSPRGLRCALGALGITPADAVYVGDRAEVDGVAADRAGMRCVIIGRAGPRLPHPSHPRGMLFAVRTYPELERALFGT